MATNIKWIRRKFKRNYKSKKRRENRHKENTRTNQFTTKPEEQNARIINPTIYLNPPAFEFNKKKNNYLLNIWKHERGIKINFDLWKPYNQ